MCDTAPETIVDLTLLLISLYEDASPLLSQRVRFKALVPGSRSRYRCPSLNLAYRSDFCFECAPADDTPLPIRPGPDKVKAQTTALTMG